MSGHNASTTSHLPSPSPLNASGTHLPFSLGFWTLAALVLTGGGLSAMLMLTDHPEWWRAFAVASGIGFVSSLVAVTPVLIAGSNVRTLMMGYLAGMMLRMMAVLALLLVSQQIVQSAKVPTAAFTLAYAMAALVAEVLVLVRAMGRLKPPTAPAGVAAR